MSTFASELVEAMLPCEYVPLLMSDRGTISSRNIKETLKMEIRRMHALRSFAIFFVALLCCTGVAFMESLETDAATSGYHIQKAVHNLLQEAKFNAITTEAQLWDYMSTVTSIVHGATVSPGKIAPLGFILFRQFRSTPQAPCDLPGLSPHWRELIEAMPSVANDDVFDTKPFGPRHAWTTTSDGLTGIALEGQLSTYPDATKAYRFELRLMENNITASLESLEYRHTNGWFDAFTRVAVIEVIFVNPTAGRFVSTTLISEISTTGTIVNNMESLVFSRFTLSTHTGRLILALDTLFVVCLMMGVGHVVTAIQMEWRLSHHQWSSLIGFWDVYLATMIIIFISAYQSRFQLRFQSNALPDDAETSMWEYLCAYASVYMASADRFSIGLIMAWLYSFYFMRFSTRLGLVTHTVQHASPTLFSMMVIFLLLLVGFSVSANILYGHYVEEFQTFASTFRYLARVVFSSEIRVYRNMTRSHRFVTPIFVVVFLLITWTVLFNMVLAVVSNSLKSVQDRVRKMNKLLHTVDTSHLEAEFEIGNTAMRYAMKKMAHFGVYGAYVMKASNDRHALLEEMQLHAAELPSMCTFEELLKCVKSAPHVAPQLVEMTYIKARAIEEADSTSGKQEGVTVSKMILAKLALVVPIAKKDTSASLQREIEVRALRDGLTRIEEKLQMLDDRGYRHPKAKRGPIVNLETL